MHHRIRATAKLHPERTKRGTKIIGLSVDSAEDHERWIADINERRDRGCRSFRKWRTTTTSKESVDVGVPTRSEKFPSSPPRLPFRT